MNAETFDSTLQAFKTRVPFEPFTVALVNGFKFEVDFPDALLVRGGVAVFVSAGGKPVIFDHRGVNQFIGDLLHLSPNPDDPKE